MSISKIYRNLSNECMDSLTKGSLAVYSEKKHKIK
jgi:hypothetical protein